MSNEIRTVELDSKEEYANFDGVKLNESDGRFQLLIYTTSVTVHKGEVSWTHVKEIGNTGLLVSVHHCYNTSANLEVFDVSQKGQAQKIYSFEEVSGSKTSINISLVIIISSSDWSRRCSL